MRKLIMAAAVLLFGAVMLPAQNLPDVQVENMSGEQVRIRDVVAGKPAIISFWGVTCKPAMHYGAEHSQCTDG